MKIGLAQINSTVGDLAGNARRIVDACRALEAGGAEIILTPELVLTGYPPQDLLFQSDFVPASLAALEEIHREVGTAVWIVGCVQKKRLRIRASVFQCGGDPRAGPRDALGFQNAFADLRCFQRIPLFRAL